ncbi:MAG: hypothetical protein R3359_06950, partial [Marinirhabdus sp.]|nr:hypothetical protein [Marinirhabdus sp.]
MEINALEIGVILIVLAAAPILYIIFSTNASHTKVKNRFTALCSANGVHLTNYEAIGSAILGLDASLNKLVYSSASDIENRFQVVPLSEVKHCEVKTAQSNKKYLEFVELELIGNAFKNDIVVYEEQDESVSTDPNMCLYELKKWEKLIKQQLS